MTGGALVRRHLEDGILVVPGVYDALSAKVFAGAGAKALFVGGFNVSASLLGQPDVGLLTLSEVVSVTRNVVSAVNVPVLADGEGGYGGVVNVQRTVRELEAAGAAGMFIEDQELPVKCGALAQYKRVLPAEEMLVKLRAALDARRVPDFIIAARTDSDVAGVAEQVRRCNLYAEAGADLAMPLAAERDEFRQLIEGISCPLWVNVTPQVEVTIEELRQMGFRGIAQFPQDALFVAMKAVQALAEEMLGKETTSETRLHLGAPGHREFFRFMNVRGIARYEEDLRAKSP